MDKGTSLVEKSLILEKQKKINKEVKQLNFESRFYTWFYDKGFFGLFSKTNTVRKDLRFI